MSLHVQSQVVGAGERPLAQVTLERTVARVLAEVTREFVGAGELPAAAFPAAVVRLLTCRGQRERERGGYRGELGLGSGSLKASQTLKASGSV